MVRAGQAHRLRWRGFDTFGSAVAVDGDTAVVGARYDGEDNIGSAYVFRREAGTWAEQAKLTATDDAINDNSGFAVAIGASVAISGATALVGASGHDTAAGIDAGSASVFDLSLPPVPLPSLSVHDVTVVEGDSGKRTARFTVSLSEASTGAVSLRAATANGGARTPTDYVARTGFLSFTAGQISATFDVKVKGDTVVEANETFVVRLDQPEGATIADGTGTGTILDDD